MAKSVTPAVQLADSPPSFSSDAVAVFARAPSPGKAKTRLISSLGARGAAEFQSALIADVLHKVDSLPAAVSRYCFLAGGRGTQRVWSADTTGGVPAFEDLPDSLSRSRLARFVVLRQKGRDLGKRLTSAFRELLRRHTRAVVIGTDSPLLAARALRLALHELRFCDAVLGPSPDGGYFLIGLARWRAGILNDVRWGSPFAFRDTMRNLLQRGLSCSVLAPCEDVDRPRDLARLRRTLLQDRAARRRCPATWRFLKARFALDCRASACSREGR